MKKELVPVFSIDWKGFPIFNLMVSLAFLFSIIIYINNLKTIEDSKSKKEKSIFIFTMSFLIGIVFSNIFNWFIFKDLYNLSLLDKIKYGGFTFYFGFIIFCLISALLLKINSFDLIKYFNIITPSIALFHSIGRLGCLLAGCCYGKIVKYTFFSLNILRFPVREIEAFLLFLIFIFLNFVVKNRRFLIYLITYSIIRFILEFFRGDDRGYYIFNKISISQFISLIIFFISCIYIYKNIIKGKRSTST